MMHCTYKVLTHVVTLILLLLSPPISASPTRRQSATAPLPVADFGRLGAGSAVVDGKWLIIGGSPRTVNKGVGLNETTFVSRTRTIASSIQILDLSTGNITNRRVTPPSSGNVNRMDVRSQTCEYDSANTKLVYCFGGLPAASNGSNFVPNVGVLDPTKMEWNDEIQTDALVPRQGPSSVLLGGVMYIFGGRGIPTISTAQSPAYLSVFHSLDVTTHSIQEIFSSPAPSSRAYHCAAILTATSFIIIGGTEGTTALGDAWVYDVKAGTWTNVTEKILGSGNGRDERGRAITRGGHSCVWSEKGVVISGGYGKGNYLLNDIWIIDPTTLVPTRQNASDNAPEGRAFHSSAAVGPYIALFGGETVLNATTQDWEASDPVVHFYDPRISQSGVAAGFLSAVAFGPAVKAIVPPGQIYANPSGNDNTGDDDGGDDDNTGKIAAGILGVLGLLLLCCAWGMAINRYRKRDHHHHIGSGLVHQDRHLVYTAPAHSTAPATTFVAPMQQQSPTGPPLPAPVAGNARPGNASAALSSGIMAAIIPVAATTLVQGPNQHDQQQNRNFIHQDKSARPSLPTRTPTIPVSGNPAPHATTQPHPQPPSGSLNVVPAGVTLATDLNHDELQGGSVAQSGQLYRALWAHTPQQPDELDVRPGDVVQERRAFADGWMLVKGNDGRCGMVPRNILKPLTG